MDVIIYTDGSVSNNGKPDAVGGWACILQAYKNNVIISEIEKSGKLLSKVIPVTNNRAEMYAILKALESVYGKCNIKVYSDSELVVKTMNNEYTKRNNLDLWYRIENAIDSLKEIGCNIEILWVKGHSDNALNNRVDRLASNAKKKN